MDNSINNNNQQRDESQINLSYVCPKCKSGRVQIGYPDIQCPSCGWSEPLIDFPISWDWHRYYCQEYGLPDPDPCEAPEHNVAELHDRLLSLENRMAGLSEEELKRLGFKHIWEEVRELKQSLHFTYKRIGEQIRAKRKPQRKKRIKTHPSNFYFMNHGRIVTR